MLSIPSERFLCLFILIDRKEWTVSDCVEWMDCPIVIASCSIVFISEMSVVDTYTNRIVIGETVLRDVSLIILK